MRPFGCPAVLGSPACSRCHAQGMFTAQGVLLDVAFADARGLLVNQLLA
jgi:hypothetical protein